VVTKPNESEQSGNEISLQKMKFADQYIDKNNKKGKPSKWGLKFCRSFYVVLMFYDFLVLYRLWVEMWQQIVMLTVRCLTGNSALFDWQHRGLPQDGCLR
jgi:hypothetical protein